MCYYKFSDYLKERFGGKVAKISLNPGFGCPNRFSDDGTGGCLYCNEKGFSKYATAGKDLKVQIEESIYEAKTKNKANMFMAYFQSGTGTYAEPLRLKECYDVIRDYAEIVALSVSTRPDCVDAEKLDVIKEYSKDYEVWIEYGLQSVNDRSLEKVQRGHTFSTSKKAIIMAHERGIRTGVHVILGLPGETRVDMIRTAEEVARLPVDGIKLHMLHVLKDTPLESCHEKGEIYMMSEKEYVVTVCDFLEYSSPACVILRLVSDAKKEVLVAPEWMNDKAVIIRKIKDEFYTRGTVQGVKYAGRTQIT